MKKKVLVILAVFMLLVSILSISSTAENVAPSLEVLGHNLTLENNIYIVYYTQSENVPAGAEYGLLVWTEEQSEYTYANADYRITEHSYQTISGVTYDRFEYRNIAAKQMADNIYALCYVKDGNDITYSELDKYSVLQYAYNKLNNVSTKASLKELLKGMLDYGALAQTYFNYNVSRLANDTYYQVDIVDGKLSDGTVSGLYHSGEKINVTTVATNENGDAFVAWKNSSGTNVADTATAEIIAGSKNETYTASYEVLISTPTFIVDNVNAEAGAENVAVTISIKKNPGLSSIALSLNYDKNALTLTGYEYNAELGGQKVSYKAGLTSYKLIWIDYETNMKDDIVFATLYFSVNPTAANGEYEVEVSYDPDDVYDVYEENVYFDVKNGCINVK